MLAKQNWSLDELLELMLAEDFVDSLLDSPATTFLKFGCSVLVTVYTWHVCSNIKTEMNKRQILKRNG